MVRQPSSAISVLEVGDLFCFVFGSGGPYLLFFVLSRGCRESEQAIAQGLMEQASRNYQADDGLKMDSD